MLALFSAATGWLLFLSLALATGVALGRWFILSSAAREDVLSAARLGLAAALLLTVSLGLVFLRQLLEFHDPFVPWGEDLRLLLVGTDWGRTWLLGLAAALVAAGGFRLASREREAGWPVATAAVLGLGAFPGFTGHANSGEIRPLTLTADALHVWAVGGWIGGLALVLFLEFRRRRGGGEHPPSLLGDLVPRFSRLAVVCVLTLVVTGVFASWVHLESAGALLHTRYGRFLLLKLALVACVLPLGALNWRRLTPKLRDPAGSEAMRRAATLELVLANVVFAVTAILVRTSPLDS